MTNKIKAEVFNATFFIRVFITLVLVYFVFTETGKFTASALALIFIALEMIGVIMKIFMKMIFDELDKIGGKREGR